MNKVDRLQRKIKRLESILASELKISSKSHVENIIRDHYSLSQVKVTNWNGSQTQHQILMPFWGQCTFGMNLDTLESIMKVCGISHLYATEDGIHIVFT